MSLTKKNRFWHYDFIFKGRRYQGSTHQTNINKAKLVEAKVRSDTALEAFGIGPRKEAPLFKQFMEGRFEESVRMNAKAKRTAKSYREKAKPLLAYPPFAAARLDQIDGDMIERYKAHRMKTVAINTLNGELATLRKALRLAHEWKLIPACPKVRLLPNGRQRNFVVSGELENAYLAVTDYPLKQAAILILDLGLRPEECVRLKKVDISDDTLIVREGKSVNAARALPLTQRALASIELLSALWPDSEFLFKGSKGKHFTRGALNNLHTKAKKANDWPADFVLYSFRHTFGTRLAESGASVFDIKRLMGHFSVKVSERYIHPTAGGIELAMKRKEELDKILRGEAAPSESTTKDRK